MRAGGIRAIARSFGYGAVAVAIVAAALHFRPDDPKAPDLTGDATASATDRLVRELAHCQGLGTAAKDDPACAAAWAENRRRFFSYAPMPSTAAASVKPAQPQ